MNVIETLKRLYDSVTPFGYPGPMRSNDIEFMNCVIDSLPALLAVVDAAREFQLLTHWGMSDSEADLSDKLNKALAQLEK